MKKFTANYSYTNPNFVIQNLPDTKIKNDFLIPTTYVLKNILQRGFPTTLSKFLQSKLGSIHLLDNFNERFLCIDTETPIWFNTILGDENNNNYPAKVFFEEILPKELGKYNYISSLFLPEVEINEIVNQYSEEFVYQQVDFYAPSLRLVIEIDGQQHKLQSNRVSDKKRDEFLQKNNITVLRITTLELKNGQYKNKLKDLISYLQKYDKLLSNYEKSYLKIKSNKITPLEVETKLLPTSIIRFQLLILELLEKKRLDLNSVWNFNILTYEDVGDFAKLAIDDLKIWLSKLWELRLKEKLKFPEIKINYIKDYKDFIYKDNYINIDFSIFKRYTDKNKLHKNIIFVRTDYFDILRDKNYFRVSTTDPINYNIVDTDKENIEFFLYNIFDKPNFREGQFPIIANALNQKDTIGLLPTGGGKSLCYQLPCLLQPAINFVVCPIKSLMYDQNDNLVKTLITNVNFITSDLSPQKRAEIELNFELGKYLFVWISPEKLQIPKFRNRLSAIISKFSIAYAVIDEVHCLSEWGHDFRTSYLNLAKTIDLLSPKDSKGEGIIKFIGLTATASVNVLKDIKIEFSRQKNTLEDENIKALLDYSRKELEFYVINDHGQKFNCLINLLENLRKEENFITSIEKAGLIFTPYVNGPLGCYSVANQLSTKYGNNIGWFAGSIPNYNKKPIMNIDDFNQYKQQIQKAFKDDKYQLLVSTKAFGMGIDKQNIYYTIHYGLPSSIESLYQEAGRAGRWDKRLPDNKDAIGKCFVLHSQETIDDKIVQQLFNRSTTFSEIREINNNVRFLGKDIFKQMFLFIQGQQDIEEDFQIINHLIKSYFKEKSKVIIYWKDAYVKLKITSDRLEKEIYRLSLLGIVSDWSTNFINSYEVDFNTINEEHIINSISQYILKYEPTTNILNNIKNSNGNSILEKSIHYLLRWIFENISYNRKQSLKTLSDWCCEYKDSDSFKKRLDSYFTFNDLTFVLQHISETPLDYEKWFQVLPLDKLMENNELETLKDSMSRFLESYRNNMGLNFISGLLRLILDEFDDTDGRERFESALADIQENYNEYTQDKLLTKLITFGKLLPTKEQKVNLSYSILELYPEKMEFLAQYYQIDYIKIHSYNKNIEKLKQLTRGLHEQLKSIR